jgi:hypothetical protein
MKSILLVISCFAFAFSLFVGVDRFYHASSYRFSLSKITSSFSPHPDWELPALSAAEQQEVDQILSQPFTFFNKGSQAYAFISQDGQYILKFFKQHKLRPKTWLAYFDQQERMRTQKKLEDSFSSCKTAYVALKEQTGLLYAHLNPSSSLPSVTLTDKQGKTRRMPLGKTSFVLQKKALMPYPHFTALMKKGDVEGAKSAISTLFDLLKDFNRIGVTENDPILKKNFGFVADQAIQIDIGKLKVDPACAHSLDLRSITTSLRTWIANNYPELSAHAENKLLDISSE